MPGKAPSEASSQQAPESGPDRHWTVYIIEAGHGHLYTGITTDLERRLEQHRSGRGGARFFRLSPANRVVYCERGLDRREAARREAAIKKMRRRDKLALLCGDGAQPIVGA